MVGVLGAGFISDYHIAGLRAAGAEVVSVFSQNGEKARRKADQYGIPHSCNSVDEILARNEIAAVVIATPDFTHEALAVAAAAAGKATLLQKPMAPTSAAARRIIAAAAKAGVPLVVSFMHRYFEEVVQARQILVNGALGEISMVRQRNGTPGADWAAWFYQKERVGGGVVLQLGVHGIDLLRQLFGEIAAVKAVTRLVQSERTLADGSVVEPNNEDLAIALYRFASGVIAVHEMSYNEVAGIDRFRMEIYGAAGTAWLRSERGRFALVAPAVTGEAGWVPYDLPEAPFGESHHRHFLTMVSGEAPVDASARDGLAALLVAEAIYRSAENGEWTEVDPV